MVIMRSAEVMSVLRAQPVGRAVSGSASMRKPNGAMESCRSSLSKKRMETVAWVAPAGMVRRAFSSSMTSTKSLLTGPARLCLTASVSKILRVRPSGSGAGRGLPAESCSMTTRGTDLPSTASVGRPEANMILFSWPLPWLTVMRSSLVAPRPQPEGNSRLSPVGANRVSVPCVPVAAFVLK